MIFGLKPIESAFNFFWWINKAYFPCIVNKGIQKTFTAGSIMIMIMMVKVTVEPAEGHTARNSAKWKCRSCCDGGYSLKLYPTAAIHAASNKQPPTLWAASTSSMGFTLKLLLPGEHIDVPNGIALQACKPQTESGQLHSFA